MACTAVQAVVKANSQRNGNRQISTPQWLQNPCSDSDETWNIGLQYIITLSLKKYTTQPPTIILTVIVRFQ